MESHVFNGAQDGPTLCILGRIHGDEPCGTLAINRLVSEIHAGHLTLQRGRLVCVPVVNEAAAARNTRFIDRNLNRILGTTDTRDTEGALAETLKPILAACDYLLDIHSYTVGGPPFVFAADDTATLGFAAALPAAVTITGFQDCYQKAFPDKEAAGMGTTEYARAHGAVSVTYEAGQHRDPQSPENAYAAIRMALAHVGLIAASTAAVQKARHVRMKQVFIKTGAGRFIKPWSHLEPIRAGDVFAVFDDGVQLQTALNDGVVVLPRADVAIGTEWGYLAV